MGRPFRCERLAHLPRYSRCVYAVLFDGGVVKIGATCWPRQRALQLERETGNRVVRMHMHDVQSGLEQHALEKRALRLASSITAPLPGRLEYFDALSFDDALQFIAEAA